MRTLAFVLMVALVGIGTPTGAIDKKVWTIADHVAAIQKILAFAKEVRDTTLRNPRYTGHERELAAKEFQGNITDLEDWLALAVKAKQGDYDAASRLYDRERDGFRLLLTSAEFLGLDQDAYEDYLAQRAAQREMFTDLLLNNRRLQEGPP